MEEKNERIMQILETWMNQNNIPKSEQIKYYHKLVALLESKTFDLKNMVLSISLASSGISFGIGSLLDIGELNIYLGILSIIFGVVILIPNKKENKYLKEYEEIEEKRELIKKWWQEKKN